MAEVSKIEWTDATFNPWIGCTAVSPACDHCYAEALSKARLGVAWGKGEPRRRTSNGNWKLPLRWNRKAEREGRRLRVFSASLADVFDAEVPDAWRDELFALIAATPNLDWLLLTKRPKVMRDYADLAWRCGEHWLADQLGTPAVQWPLPNVWLGTTVENQAMAEARIPHLLATPAAVRFLSMEPLLGPVDLTRVLIGESPAVFDGQPAITKARFTINALAGVQSFGWPGIDWVITGGESGPGARPSHPDWLRSIRDQCAAAGVAFFFKQWGEWAPGECVLHTATRTEQTAELINEEWRFGSLSPQASQEMHRDDEPDLYRVGKKAAGRWLDGLTWDEVPEVRP
ncbi:phage Gp37/Gp68 family protein [Azospirillum sp. BE72]|uniref:phage Gp37/Gp68 family protein n=1 Tax=Azospirillum sp. BE72 TaxID=2817776 RepID=UPI002858EEB3|nr:phage Gp37/Gp68 family protein [Azospirillum sp. BE72]MDR6771810.1 protein gp37 [Azospirillum sp. BE72]